MTLRRQVLADGPEDADIVIVTESPSYDDAAAKRLMSDYGGRLFFDQFRRAGLLRSRIRVEAVCEEVPPGRRFFLLDDSSRRAWREDCMGRLASLGAKVFVPLGEGPLELLTGRKGIDKWQMSILPGVGEIAGRKCVPLFAPERILRVTKDLPWVTLGAERVAHEAQFAELRLPARELRIRPTLDDIQIFCSEVVTSEWLSLDIETGRGQITCVGIADSEKRGMSIPTLPQDWPDAWAFHRVWALIAQVCASPARKIFQNGIYDTTYFAKYGIRVENFAHDTMIAQKILHAELPMGLDAIARMYTREPYWKDDAKDWGSRQDIGLLYEYNVRDCCVTYEAAMAQREDLLRRGLIGVFTNYSMRLTAPVAEMCWRGLPVNSATKERLRRETEGIIEGKQAQLDTESEKITGKKINPRSPKQVKDLIRAAGMKLPFKDGKETSNVTALLKLKLRRPESKLLSALISLSAEQKRLSSYLSFEYDTDSRMRYSLLAHGTETLRMSCYTDPWGRGLNAQTVPHRLREMFEAPAGSSFVEIDLRQAESRFVAWDGPEPTLMEMFQSGADIHRFVAAQPELFNCDVAAVTKDQRQLGKKTGHAANYGVREHTLSESCLKEMDLDLPIDRAASMLAGYHRIFPGIRRWQARIRDEVVRSRVLRTPFGTERYFYDRPGDDLWREAYAHKPQSTIPYVINQLMLHMQGHAHLLLQGHDSLLLEVPDSRFDAAFARVCDQDAWNPRMLLAGGELRIPIEVKRGRIWGRGEVIYEG